MKDNKVYYLHFGKAIDKNEAKNDKYLNQIINAHCQVKCNKFIDN
ncbi:hypothetical protein FOB78_08025 [Streptococcus agalactiae]|nr:hypothetical protein FOB78_08025 [Streptococcus agalactiae]